MSTKDEHQLEIETLADGADRLLENATSLFGEGIALRNIGAVCRGFCLHQLSLEECAKIEMLGALAVSTLIGHRVDLRKFAKAFASHKAKNHTNAYSLPVTGAEATAREAKRWDESMEAFRTMQEEFHSQSNIAKNASLYVNFRDGQFSSPKDSITPEMVDTIARANAQFLESSGSKVRLLRRWVDEREQTREQVDWMTERLSRLSTETDDPEAALGTVLDDALERFMPAK